MGDCGRVFTSRRMAAGKDLWFQRCTYTNECTDLASVTSKARTHEGA